LQKDILLVGARPTNSAPSGCVLRITDYDELPRMIMQGLGRNAMLEMLADHADQKMSGIICDVAIPLAMRARGMAMALREKFGGELTVPQS